MVENFYYVNSFMEVDCGLVPEGYGLNKSQKKLKKRGNYFAKWQDAERIASLFKLALGKVKKEVEQ